MAKQWSSSAVFLKHIHIVALLLVTGCASTETTNGESPRTAVISFENLYPHPLGGEPELKNAEVYYNGEHVGPGLDGWTVVEAKIEMLPRGSRIYIDNRPDQESWNPGYPSLPEAVEDVIEMAECRGVEVRITAMDVTRDWDSKLKEIVESTR